MSRALPVRLLAPALVVAVSCLVVAVATAVPRYSARAEQDCKLCHVSPGGGGMRTAYAVEELIPKELAMSAHRPEALVGLETRLNKVVRVGADFRQQFMLEDESAPAAAVQGFFPMQGDLHLSFQLDPRHLLFYRRGTTSLQEFGWQGQVLPWDGHVRAGRFVPSYGWRFDDHTMYVRDDLGFAPPGNSDAGLEVGFSPERGDLTVSLLNGNRGGLLDNDRRLVVAATGGFRFRFGDAAAYVGAQGWRQPGLNEDLTMAGLHGSVALGKFTWVGQYDRTRREPVVGRDLETTVASNEFSVELERGVELLGTFDWYDPDRDLESGFRQRWGAGAQVMPLPFMSVRAMLRRTDVHAGPALAGQDGTEALLQLHLLY